MMAISRLYCSRPSLGEANPFSRTPAALPSPFEPMISNNIPTLAAERKPIVVWSATRTCNLNCTHCTSDSRLLPYPGQLSTAEAQVMIEDLAQFGVPALVFSGGEPLMYPDLPELIAHARGLGICPALSTNATLITPAVAADLKRVGVAYVGVSLEGLGPTNDYFRGKNGAFDTALAGLRNSVAAGLRVGLRMTLTRRNFHGLEAIFDFIAREKIHRACFHHLVYGGRGNDMLKDDLTHEQTRQAMNIILRRAADFYRRGRDIEILTADNLVDGVYLYLKILKKDPARAAEVYRLLKWNGSGAYGSGVGISGIDHQGNVHADPFWSSHTFGNVRGRPFSEIWTDLSDPLMAGLKDPLPRLKGCCATCHWTELCGGGSRVRAERVYGDPWMPDPACYLTSDELRRDLPDRADKMADALLWNELAA